jgi:hypothetical protein
MVFLDLSFVQILDRSVKLGGFMSTVVGDVYDYGKFGVGKRAPFDRLVSVHCYGIAT